MAKTSRANKEAKCIPVDVLTRRLAASFQPLNWSLSESIDLDDVANHLGVNTEDVQALAVAGLLKTTEHPYSQDTIELSDLVTFLDANPWWYAQRAAKQVERLRDELSGIAHSARLARLRARRAARKAVRS